VSAADFWILAGILIMSWVIFPAAAFLAWGWALRTHTLYRAMRADLQAGRPAAPALELVAALERHHHAAARPGGIRIPRPRIPRRQHPQHADVLMTPDGPEVVVLADSCTRCAQVICPRCQGCSCPISLCECTKITAIGPGR
jgi:hypothetical protein